MTGSGQRASARTGLVRRTVVSQFIFEFTLLARFEPNLVTVS